MRATHRAGRLRCVPDAHELSDGGVSLFSVVHIAPHKTMSMPWAWRQKMRAAIRTADLEFNRLAARIGRGLLSTGQPVPEGYRNSFSAWLRAGVEASAPAEVTQ